MKGNLLCSPHVLTLLCPLPHTKLEKPQKPELSCASKPCQLTVFQPHPSRFSLLYQLAVPGRPLDQAPHAVGMHPGSDGESLWCANRSVESQNHRMVWLEGTFKVHLVQPYCHEQGHLQLDQAAQSPVQPECFQGWGVYHLLGQPAPEFHS